MTINQYIDEFFNATAATPLGDFHPTLGKELETFYNSQIHGRRQEWDKALAALPHLTTHHFNLASDCVEIGEATELNSSIESGLRQFHPWRKGPFSFFGTKIDTEWRSDWKWQRIQPHITDLDGRTVLDIGCGNGYHLFRMLGDGASLAVGVDPTRLFLYQFHVARSFMPAIPAYLIPLRSEHLPAFNLFDTVFSLGVLYHRRSPIEHLMELFSFLRPGGEVVLESLIIDGDRDTVLIPKDRYAKMANVWFLPSTDALELWLYRAGFREIRTIDVTRTSTDEQRATSWMTFQSLSDFLDPNDPGLTAEGLPAPQRAILIAQKPLKQPISE